ncbi:MAG: hypothetical protein AB4080_08425 [Trichodesmium sp.]
MVTKLTLIPIKGPKPKNRIDSAIAKVALVISHTQNSLYQWEKNPVLLSVGWLKSS